MNEAKNNAACLKALEMYKVFYVTLECKRASERGKKQ